MRARHRHCIQGESHPKPPLPKHQAYAQQRQRGQNHRYRHAGVLAGKPLASNRFCREKQNTLHRKAIYRPPHWGIRRIGDRHGGGLRMIKSVKPLGMPKRRRGLAFNWRKKRMITTLKLLMAGILGWAVLNPGGFSPRADDCECKAKAATKIAQPRASDCECKADTLSRPVRPASEDCSCKADVD